MRNPNLTKIRVKDAVSYLSGNRPFDADSIWATSEEQPNGHATYCVFSYGVLIAKHENGVIQYFNANKYSTTTSKHQNFVVRAWGLSGKAIDKAENN